MLAFAVASYKYPRLIKFLYCFAAIDMACHCTLRVPVTSNEDEYRFLVMVILQGLFQFGPKSALLMTTLANIGFIVIEMQSSSATSIKEDGRIFTLILWLILQALSTLAIQMVINAVGRYHTDVQVLAYERTQSTLSKAKNVFVLDQNEHDVIASKVRSKWLA